MNERPSAADPSGNRLANEKSPYLRMHARNPVDWYPWGEEAFEKARRENKPIFLSIGYYTCHWCHVMERESFANEAIAALLNRDFVSIKVDREERPDVDRLYMSFVQATTGGGGWPLSAFLTPELKPFLGGTYFPPNDMYGRPGFATVLRSIAQTWQNEQERITDSAGQVAQALEKYLKPEAPSAGALQSEILERLQMQLAASFDAHDGGFGHAPKFPRPVAYTFLMQDSLRTGRRESLEMTVTTLRAMARGGIYDHLGGGFHRYSTDAVWLVPHFEKMLYDQAQLVVSYLQAWQCTGEPLFAEVARETLDFVQSEMTSPKHGFYSAQDADSQISEENPEHAEGAFYVWTQAEIEAALPAASAAAFCRQYGVRAEGNVPLQQGPHGELRGKNVLHRAESLEATAQATGCSVEETAEHLATARSVLFQQRTKRPHPPTDDKVLTAWNGLMISAFAQAARILDQEEYLRTAQRAARFIEAELYDVGRGVLRRRWREGEIAIDGFVDDYAFLIHGLLDLYEADFDPHWLVWADRLQQMQDRLFWATPEGGYYGTTGEDGSLFLRLREDYDGAEPSPNSVAVDNLLRLAQFTGRSEYRQRAEAVLQAFAGRLKQIPEAMPAMVAALDRFLVPPRQLIIAGDPAAADTRKLLSVTAGQYLPYHIVMLLDSGGRQKVLEGWQSHLAGYGRLHGAAAAYVCENFTCQLPTTDSGQLGKLLKG